MSEGGGGGGLRVSECRECLSGGAIRCLMRVDGRGLGAGAARCSFVEGRVSRVGAVPNKA